MNNLINIREKYIVITRPEPGLSETAKKVKSLGWVPLLMPIMTIQALPIHYLEMDSVQAIILTSRQAIAPLLQQFKKQQIDFYHFPVFTVGDITAQDAKKAGFINVQSARKDASTLALLIKEKLLPKEGSLLFPSAKGQGQLIYGLLKQAGFSVLHLQVYQSQSVQKLSYEFLYELQSQTINSILFFSSETARFFIELLTKDLQKYLKNIQAIGISSKTKNILESVSWKSIDIASHPNTKEMLSLLKEHF